MALNKKYFILFVLLSLLFTITACGTDNKPPVDEEKTVESIKFKDDESTFTFNIDEFMLKDIELEVTYSDDTKEIVPVTRDMLSDDDFIMLFTTGSYFIKINFEQKELEATIQMSAGTQSYPRLSEVVVYSLQTFEDGKLVYEVYTTGNGQYVSYDLNIIHDTNKDNISIVSEEDLLIYDLEDSKVRILQSFGKVVSKENYLFKIVVDDINAHFQLERSESVFYGYSDEVYVIEDVRYYNR